MTAIWFAFGAWYCHRHGMAWALFATVVLAIAATLDHYFGTQVGHDIGAATRTMWLHLTGAA